MQQNLDLFKKNVYSQNGEDGIIQQLLVSLNITSLDNPWCVEFGAWDGKHLSNTFNLVESGGWNAVYIEADSQRFADLLETVQEFEKIIPVNAFVEYNNYSENSLTNILKTTAIPRGFELLSIDIDSFDLDIWESLDATLYNPKIVVIEINSSAVPGLLWRHTPQTQGNTFSSTIKVAEEKGYTLVCHTGNLIFVRSDLIGLVKIDNRFIKYPELLFRVVERLYINSSS